MATTICQYGGGRIPKPYWDHTPWQLTIHLSPLGPYLPSGTIPFQRNMGPYSKWHHTPPDRSMGLDRKWHHNSLDRITDTCKNITFLQLCLLAEKITITNLAWSTGDMVQVVYRLGSDATPLWAATNYYYNGFTGFRIWVNVKLSTANFFLKI